MVLIGTEKQLQSICRLTSEIIYRIRWIYIAFGNTLTHLTLHM